jgi:hypothetical protein
MFIPSFRNISQFVKIWLGGGGVQAQLHGNLSFFVNCGKQANNSLKSMSTTYNSKILPLYSPA